MDRVEILPRHGPGQQGLRNEFRGEIVGAEPAQRGGKLGTEQAVVAAEGTGEGGSTEGGEGQAGDGQSGLNDACKDYPKDPETGYLVHPETGAFLDPETGAAIEFSVTGSSGPVNDRLLNGQPEG